MDTVGLLMGLIRIPSFSREEGAAADFLEAWMRENGFAEIHRAGNNLWVESGPQDERPTILLNAHIDTVKPSPGYTRDPFEPALEGDVLYGLGSNDDGGSLVALIFIIIIKAAAVQACHLCYGRGRSVREGRF